MLFSRSTASTWSMPRFGPNLPSVTYSGPSPRPYLSDSSLFSSFSGRQFTGQRKHPAIPLRYGSMLGASSLSVHVVSWLFFVPMAPSRRLGL
jgi:hypothetical protein